MCAGSSLLRGFLCSCGRWGLLCGCGCVLLPAAASLAVERRLRSWHTGLAAPPCTCRVFQERDWTRGTYVGRWVLYHRATRGGSPLIAFLERKLKQSYFICSTGLNQQGHGRAWRNRGGARSTAAALWTALPVWSEYFCS